jgi:segregation and condensation protein B
MQNVKNIIESLLFVAEEPLTIEKIRTVLETVETKDIRTALDGLADQYAARGGGFFLCEVAGGWQLRSRPEYNEWIKRMLQPSPRRLTKAALETLAIVAYNQPIIRADIEHIRGVDCGGVLRQLMERKLIRVLGRKEIPGRPIIYATTKLFLELFNLKSLKDLPSPKEMEELGAAEEKHPSQMKAVMDATMEKTVEQGQLKQRWFTVQPEDEPETADQPERTVQQPRNKNRPTLPNPDSARALNLSHTVAEPRIMRTPSKVPVKQTPIAGAFPSPALPASNPPVAGQRKNKI